MGSTLHRARAPAHGPYGPDTSAARRWTRRRGGAGVGAPAGEAPRRPARSAFSAPIGHWAAGPLVLPGVRTSVLKIGGSVARGLAAAARAAGAEGRACPGHFSVRP